MKHRKKNWVAVGQSFILAVIIALFSAHAASAQDWRDRDRDHDNGWHRGEHHVRVMHHRHRHVVVVRPYYDEDIYAPPPVVYYPPEPVGLSLIFPLHFR
jgi:hypothetical protein